MPCPVLWGQEGPPAWFVPWLPQGPWLRVSLPCLPALLAGLLPEERGTREGGLEEGGKEGGLAATIGMRGLPQPLQGPASLLSS